MAAKTVAQPVFRAPALVDVDERDLIKLAYLADPSKARFIECREDGHHWKRQHKGWLQLSPGEPFQKTYRCIHGCQGVKVKKRIEGESRNFYYIDPEYYLQGARLLRREIDDYAIDLAKAGLKAEAQTKAKAASAKPTRPQRSAPRTAKPPTAKERKR